MPERHRKGTPGFRRANLGLFVAGLAAFALLYCPQPVLPLIAEGFGGKLSPATASLSLAVSTGALALAVIPLSTLSDSVGRTGIMTFSLFGAAALGLLAAFAPSYPSLLVIRAVQGVALAGLPAVAMAYVAEEVHHRSLGLAMGLYIAGNGVGGMGGRLMASLAADVGSWRWAFGVTGVFALGCLLVFRVALPPSAHFVPRSLRPRAVAEAMRGHLADPGLRRLYAVGLLLMAAFVAVYNYLGYRLLAPPFGLPPGLVGFIFVVYLAGTASAATAGRLTNRLGRRRALWSTSLVAAPGLALTLPTMLPLVILGLTVLTFGFFSAHTIASGWVGARATAAKGQASALYLLCYYLGSSLGGWIGGIAYGYAAWPGTAAFVAALLTGAVTVALSLRNVR